MTKTHPGSYYKWYPADAEILRRLPPEGAAVGWHVLAATVDKIIVAMNKDVPPEGRITAGQCAGRLRAMQQGGYVVQVPVMGQHNKHTGWQRTKKGTLLREEKTGERLDDGAFTTNPTLTVVEGGVT